VSKLPQNDSQRDELAIFYGDAGGWFKCPKAQCFAFSEGFPTPELRDTHFTKHERPFRCLASGCLYATIGFTSAGELKRHNSKSHPFAYEAEEVEFPQASTASGPAITNNASKANTSKDDAVKDDDPRSSQQSENGARSSSLPSSTPSLQLKGNPPKVAPITIPVSHGAIEGRESIEDLVSKIKRLDLKKLSLEDLSPYKRRQNTEDEWISVFPSTSSPFKDVDLLYTFQHTSVVCCVRFSNDGKYLATGCNRASQIFDTVKGGILCVLQPEFTNVDPGENYCRSLCFSPDGRLLATGWEDKLIRIWDVNSQLIKTIFSGHENDIYSVDFAQDNRTVASCSGDRTARLWDLHEDQQICVFSTDDALMAVAISPDTRYLAASSLNKDVYLWETKNDYLPTRLSSHKDSIYTVRFTPDGKRLITGALDKVIKIWDLTDFQSSTRVPENLQPRSSLLGHMVRKDYDFGITRN
jgi:hypothetical protein